jgi:hypothetical protein
MFKKTPIPPQHVVHGVGQAGSIAAPSRALPPRGRKRSSFGIGDAGVIREPLQSFLMIYDRTHPRSAATAEGRRPHDLRLFDLMLTEICIADSSRIHPPLVR